MSIENGPSIDSMASKRAISHMGSSRECWALAGICGSRVLMKKES